METDAFNRTIIPLRAELLHMAKCLTGGDDIAEDYVQEVMLKLWDMRDRLENDSNPKALACTMMRNMHIDRMRHRRLETNLEAREEETAEDHTTEIRDEMALIGHIIDLLPPLQARIFRMKEIEGYESDELVRILGCSPESLRQNLSRARRHIREMFIKMTMKK